MPRVGVSGVSVDHVGLMLSDRVGTGRVEEIGPADKARTHLKRTASGMAAARSSLNQ